MKRVGKLTGKIYDEHIDPSTIGECCYCVKDEDLEKATKRQKNDDCSECRGCPEYWIE